MVGALDETEDDEFLYKQIIHDMHSVVDEAFVNWSISYKQQDPNTIGKIFILFPVLKQYQNNWATGLLVQQYMNNHHKYANKCGYPLSMGSKSGVEEADAVGKKKRTRAIIGTDDEEQPEEDEATDEDGPQEDDDIVDENSAGGSGQESDENDD
ncbi:hypothetical protein EWM64_g8997 [Hericium alpestre]|uniref:Uncharacterized protein n=1 Tax=Hericium alpestre TaxID=135208 RepID=A0A4Y9ZNC0_9AGAM|nr:hypothetical protein EWM64_g8997 [Hericium alpestre]